jgi:hypothetical protein
VNLEALIIQPDAMPAGYTITDQRQLGGDDGRVSDYFRRYNNGDIQSSASDVAHQVILYKSVDDANSAFTSLVASRQSAGFQEMTFGNLSTDRQIVLQKVDGPVTIQVVVMREGNYIIIVQTLAYSTASDRVTVLRQYVDKALDRFSMFYPI